MLVSASVSPTAISDDVASTEKSVGNSVVQLPHEKSIEEIVKGMSAQANNVEPLGAKIKFVLDDQPILIDGTGDANIVSTEDADADTTVITSKENFLKLKDGELNPMMAVMSGKVKIKGDMGLAMKLQSLM